MHNSPNDLTGAYNRKNTWHGKHVLIVGAARQGLALARFLAGKGARVTLNDRRDGETIDSACKKVSQSLSSGCKGTVGWVLGAHPLSLLMDIELVCVSGGIPLDLPLIEEAVQRGIPITNDSQIFMECAPCKVIGVTGSAGKSTTTTLVGMLAKAAIDKTGHKKGATKVWVGGNIGLPLIDLVDEIYVDDLVILELSSFQLELMTISPHVSAILNLTPNHLDRHGTMEAYSSAKRRILDFQDKQDAAVLGRDNPGSRGLSPYVKGHLVSFGFLQPDIGNTGTYIDQESIYFQSTMGKFPLITVDSIQLRGEHNILNVLAAYAIIFAAGLIPVDNPEAQVKQMQNVIRGFRGMPHRLELVHSSNGISWYNDSIATTPERTIAAIKSFHDPIILLLGGRDKDLPWDKLSDIVHERVDHVIAFGEAADKIINVLDPGSSRNTPYTLDTCNSLKKAVTMAASIAQPGDVILLSPGGTSFDEFNDFEERGERYREWIHQLP